MSTFEGKSDSDDVIIDGGPGDIDMSDAGFNPDAHEVFDVYDSSDDEEDKEDEEHIAVSEDKEDGFLCPTCSSKTAEEAVVQCSHGHTAFAKNA